MEQKNRTDYFQKLIDLMEVLRGPDGCPWDKEQTRESLKHHLIEEAYEVLQALDSGDPDELCEELGDLLFQVIFHSRIAQEKGEFDAHEVCRRVYEKMVRRHPHVFGSASYADAKELLRHWEDLKTAEKELSGRRKSDRKTLLDGIPAGLPALNTTYSISAKAARVGFDWAQLQEIREKFLEEFTELEAALKAGEDTRIQEEVGDLLFTAVNISRYLEIDPETALSRANRKFSERFRKLEQHFSTQGKPLKEVSLEEMEDYWQRLKFEEIGEPG